MVVISEAFFKLIKLARFLLNVSVLKAYLQVLTEQAIRLATDLMLLVDDESFHVLYNSLLALASVNHLHLHLLSWPYDSDLINRVSFS